MKTLLALLLPALPLSAADHIINWSANPADQFVITYVLYEQIGGVWQRRAEVPANTNSITLSNVVSGWHVYALTATNAFGESPRSVPVNALVPAYPTAPTNVIVNLRAALEGSGSMNGPWAEMIAVNIPIEKTENIAFYRLRQEIK